MISFLFDSWGNGILGEVSRKLANFKLKVMDYFAHFRCTLQLLLIESNFFLDLLDVFLVPHRLHPHHEQFACFLAYWCLFLIS